MKEKNILVIGTFDMLHAGHVNLFYNASKLGKVFVGVTSDSLNRENLTKEKLKFSESKRIEMIKPLIFVQEVILIDPKNGIALDKIISEKEISALAFGNDYENDETKLKLARDNNIEVIIFERTKDISSTKIRGWFDYLNI